MSRAPAPAVLALLASGCLPDLPPPPADGGDDDTTDGATTTVSDGMTIGATETDGATETTSGGDDDDDSDTETETDTETTGEPGGCGAIDPLVIDGNAAANCRIGVDFDIATARTLTELRAPQGSDENLLFSGSMSLIEEYSGVIQWPEYTSMESTEPRTDGQHYVVQQGPAVFRILIPWIVDAGPGEGFEGSSIYTVLADGRIFRDEYVHVFENSGDWLVAYLALRSDALPVAYWGGGTRSGSYPAPIPGNGEQESFYQADSEPAPDDDAYTCAHDAESGDTVGFAQYEGTYTTWAGPRATFLQDIAGKTQTSAFVLQADWVREMSIPLGEYAGEIMMHVDADTTRAPCSAMADYYAAYRDPGNLQVTAGGNADLPELIGNENEGDDDFAHGSGFYYMQAVGTDDIALSIEGGATQPTVLLYVAGLDPTEVSGVSVGGEALSSNEYILQVVVEEGGGTSVGGLDTGAFVLIGVPVESGTPIVISR